MQSVLVYHQATFEPSEEDETVAPFVFNCGWLGHGKNSVGGSSLTFLGELHKNHSRKTVIGTGRCPRMNNNQKHQTSFQTNQLDKKHVLHISVLKDFLDSGRKELKKSREIDFRILQRDVALQTMLKGIYCTTYNTFLS